MNKKLIVMSPTIYMTTNEWRDFLFRWSMIIKKANRTSLCIELLSGYKIYFRAETEGQRALLGICADIIKADELYS